MAALSVAGLLLLFATAGALAVTGDLSQPAGDAGCVSESTRGAEPCAEGHALLTPTSLAVSSDGKSVYVVPASSDGVVRLNRNTTTGAISQPAGNAGCISDPAYDGAEPCADGRGLISADAVAVSPDGKSVYVAAGAVVRLNRNTTTGAITQPAGRAGCISETGIGQCADGHAIALGRSVAVSPDGKSVYVVSDDGAVARLNRNTTTGAITQPAGTAGCISETGAGPCADGHGLDYPNSVAVSRDGKSVYVASQGSNAVARLVRNTTTGAITQPAGSAGCISETGAGPCADGHALNNPISVAISADSKNVYVTSYGSNAVVRLNRNTTTGAITQPAGNAGCISDAGFGAEPCAEGHALQEAHSVAISVGGRSVYVASTGSSAVARLVRNTTTGAITQPAGSAGCISETGAGPCADGHALLYPHSVAVSRDGRSVYSTSPDRHAVARLNRAPYRTP